MEDDRSGFEEKRGASKVLYKCIATLCGTVRLNSHEMKNRVVRATSPYNSIPD